MFHHPNPVFDSLIQPVFEYVSRTKEVNKDVLPVVAVLDVQTNIDPL